MADENITSRRNESETSMSYLWYWPAGGWDFEKWKSAQDWKPIRSEQSGRAELLPLENFDADKWRAIANQILGTVNDRPPKSVQWEPLGDEFEHHAGGWYSLQRLR